MTGLNSDSWHGRGYVVAVLSQMREKKRKIGRRSESLERECGSIRGHGICMTESMIYVGLRALHQKAFGGFTGSFRGEA